jgi:uncharacterized membrane protein
MAFADAVLLTYIYHYINIVQPDLCPFCGSKYSFFDGTTVAESPLAHLFVIPVAVLGVFAFLFLIVFFVAVYFLKKEALKDYLSVVYPLLGLMLAYSLYKLFQSVFIIKAVCIYCVVLGGCLFVMIVSCKKAVESNTTEILGRCGNFFNSLFSMKNRFNAALVVAAFVISLLFAFSVDHHYRYQFTIENAKKIDTQKDRVIVLLKEMLH